MEPMALGSPGGSPATNAYLPSFLLGDQQAPTTPRTNTLSPNKAGARNLSFGFGTSPGGMPAASSQDYNRSAFGQKTLFGGYQQTPPLQQNYPVTQSHNISASGPPIQGLFDSLREEQNQVQTPLRSLPPQSHFVQLNNSIHSACGVNQSIGVQQNESYINSFSSAGVMSPSMTGTHFSNMQGINVSQMLSSPPQTRYTEFWVTVFGFPSTATSVILQHFAQCGTIVDKVFPSQNGNWVHLKYSSRLECDKALNYNEKILANNIMIGVTRCRDKFIVDKENICQEEVTRNTPKVRPLAQTAYKCSQNDITGATTSTGPQKSSGFMNKAMDLFFGW